MKVFATRLCRFAQACWFTLCTDSNGLAGRALHACRVWHLITIAAGRNVQPHSPTAAGHSSAAAGMGRWAPGWEASALLQANTAQVFWLCGPPLTPTPLPVPASAVAGQTLAGVSNSKELKNAIYTELEQGDACIRLLNANGTVGCAAPPDVKSVEGLLVQLTDVQQAASYPGEGGSGGVWVAAGAAGCSEESRVVPGARLLASQPPRGVCYAPCTQVPCRQVLQESYS